MYVTIHYNIPSEWQRRVRLPHSCGQYRRVWKVHTHQKHMHTHIRTHTYAHTHSLFLCLSLSHTHTHTHSHTHAHAHTHTSYQCAHYFLRAIYSRPTTRASNFIEHTHTHHTSPHTISRAKYSADLQLAQLCSLADPLSRRATSAHAVAAGGCSGGGEHGWRPHE